MAHMHSEDRYQLQSNEANYNHLNAESDTNHSASHQSHSTLWRSDQKLAIKEAGLTAQHETSKNVLQAYLMVKPRSFMIFVQSEIYSMPCF